MRRQHQHGRLQDCLLTERHVNGHLVTVKVSVKRSTNQRVQLNGLTLDQLRLECLDTQTVQRWSAVQEHRVPFQHVLQNIPNYRIFPVNNFLSGLHRLHNASFNEFANNERLE